MRYWGLLPYVWVQEVLVHSVLMSLTITVPASVPSLFHSSVPWILSLDWK